MGAILERSLLSAAVFDEISLHEVMHGLRDKDFSDPRSKALFCVLSDLWEDGLRKPDLAIVSDAYGDPGFVASLDDAIPALGHVPLYVRKLRLEAATRRLRDGMNFFEGENDSESSEKIRELLRERDEAESAIQNLDDEELDLREMLLDFEEGDRIGTGLVDVDSKLDGGFEEGSLNTVAGVTSHGKTSIAIHSAVHAAKAGRKVAYYSLEMPERQIRQRMLSASTGIPLRAIRSRSPLVNEPPFLRGLDEMKRWNLRVRAGAFGVPDIESDARKFGAEIVFVDFLQIMRVGRAENRTRQISDITRDLKLFALESGAPVVILSQLNRAAGSEKRPPRLSDLKESSSIEQDSDVVLFVYREDVDGREALAIVAKHRNGETGMIDLYWDGPCARFRNLGRE